LQFLLQDIVTKIQKAIETFQETIAYEPIDLDIRSLDREVDLRTLNDAVTKAEINLGLVQTQALYCWYLLGRRINEIFLQSVAGNERMKSRFVVERFLEICEKSESRECIKNRIHRAKVIFTMFEGLNPKIVLNIKGLNVSSIYNQSLKFARSVNGEINYTHVI